MATVYDFGAIGDGIADDTSALQAWLDAGGGYFDPGVYRIRESLVCDGNAVVYGAGPASKILIEETDRYLGTTGVAVAMVFGRDATWNGFVRDIGVSMAAPFVGQCHVMVMISAEDCTIQNVRFTDLQAVGGSVMIAYFSGLDISHTAQDKQNDINILYNKAHWTPENAAMEFSSNTGISRRWNWTGNRAEGFGDDFLVARGDDFLIKDNHGVTDVGRIYATSVNDGLISNNKLIKRNSRGNGAGIHIDPQITGSQQSQENFQRCTNIIISDNILINEDDQFFLINPILVRGGDNISITGNHIIDRRLTFNCAVRIEHSAFNNVVYYLDDITFSNNFMDGAHFDLATNGISHKWSMTAIGNVVNGRNVVRKAYTIIDNNAVVDLTFEHNRAYDVVLKTYDFQGIQRRLKENEI